MPDIVILTPGSEMKAEYVISLVNTLNFLNDQGVSVKFGNSQGAIIARTRQISYELVRQINFQKIIWIDSDMSWQVDDFLKLIKSDKDIITGVYLDELGRIVATKTNGERISREEIEKNDLPIEIAWSGFGFMCLSKDVVDVLPEPFVKPGEYGEDVSFCMNARNLGFKVYLDPTVRVSHHKTMELKYESFN